MLDDRQGYRSWRAKHGISDSNQDDKDIRLCRLVGIVLSNRYLYPRSRPRALNLATLDQLLYGQSDSDFKNDFRLDRSNFWQLHGWLETTSEYIYRKCDLKYELMVCLYRMGFSGNAASYQKIAKYFTIAIGSVERFTAQCVSAILCLKNEAIFWPDRDERRSISKRIGTLPECVGFVDGTLFPLELKPSLHGEDYYSRKSSYAINGNVIVLLFQANKSHNHRIDILR
jgi:hypothetical protein